MSTLSNIFASSDADQAQTGSPQSFDESQGDAQVAPEPDVPGDDGGPNTFGASGTDSSEDTGAPVMLMPGGETDPEA